MPISIGAGQRGPDRRRSSPFSCRWPTTRVANCLRSQPRWSFPAQQGCCPGSTAIRPRSNAPCRLLIRAESAGDPRGSSSDATPASTTRVRRQVTSSSGCFGFSPLSPKCFVARTPPSRTEQVLQDRSPSPRLLFAVSGIVRPRRQIASSSARLPVADRRRVADAGASSGTPARIHMPGWSSRAIGAADAHGRVSSCTPHRQPAWRRDGRNPAVPQLAGGPPASERAATETYLKLRLIQLLRTAEPPTPVLPQLIRSSLSTDLLVPSAAFERPGTLLLADVYSPRRE